MERKQKKILDWYFNSNLLLRILIGLVAGAIVGVIFGPKLSFLTAALV